MFAVVFKVQGMGKVPIRYFYHNIKQLARQGTEIIGVFICLKPDMVWTERK